MTATPFEQMLAESRARQIMEHTGTLVPPTPEHYLDRIDGVFVWRLPHDHYRTRSTAWLHRNCDACCRSKVAWLAAQPESSHVGRIGRQLAQQWEYD